MSNWILIIFHVFNYITQYWPFLHLHVICFLSPDILIMVDCWELCSLPQWRSNPRRGWTTISVSRKLWSSLSFVPPTTLTSVLRMSISLLRPAINHIAISHLPSGCSSSMPHIHSLMLYAMVGGLITFFIPQGFPGPLSLVLFSTMAYAMAQWPSCTVFTIDPTELSY